MPGPRTLARRASAEFVGTALLVTAVVGSGIAAARLSPDDIGLQLLESAAATACALAAIILAIGPVSGAHINPVVSLVDRALGGLRTSETVVYVLAQVSGGALGAVAANLMFSLDAVSFSTKARGGGGVVLAEVIATAGLALVVFGTARSGRRAAAPFAIGAYIGGAYFFTSSTSFANPAVTLGRTLSNTFAGISPRSVAAFIGAQLAGGALAFSLIRFWYPRQVRDGA